MGVDVLRVDILEVEILGVEILGRIPSYRFFLLLTATIQNDCAATKKKKIQ